MPSNWSDGPPPGSAGAVVATGEIRDNGGESVTEPGQGNRVLSKTETRYPPGDGSGGCTVNRPLNLLAPVLAAVLPSLANEAKEPRAAFVHCGYPHGRGEGLERFPGHPRHILKWLLRRVVTTIAGALKSPREYAHQRAQAFETSRGSGRRRSSKRSRSGRSYGS